MQGPPVDPTGESCDNVSINTKPNPQTEHTEVVTSSDCRSSVSSVTTSMTPCSPPAGCRDSGYVTDGSPANMQTIPFAFDPSPDQSMHLSLPSSPSLTHPQQHYRYRHLPHNYHHRQAPHTHFYRHQIGAVGAVGGHGPENPAPSSVSSLDLQEDDDTCDHLNVESEDEEEEDDVFASDSVSDSFPDDNIPNYPVRASQPIPIRNPGRVDRYNNNNNNNNNNNTINNDNLNLSSDSLGLGLSYDEPSYSSYPFDDRPRHWQQQLYHLRTSSEMSPDLDHVGNCIPCSWAPELRRTIGTQTHPTLRTNPILNLAACRLRNQQRLTVNPGQSQRRLRFSEGEDPMSESRQEPLPDIVPIPRNRAQSLPEVPIRRTNIRAFGQELRRISDEYYQSHNTRNRQQQPVANGGQAFSFPGADGINRVLYRILSLGRPLNADDDPEDQPPPPP